MTSLLAALFLGQLPTDRLAPAVGPKAAITIRLARPDRQALAVIDLFRGSRAAHPAAALAAWKRAGREPDRLGKPLEALIAAINPAMAAELRTLDGASLALWFDPESGRPEWGASLPSDDGTFEALATAFVLSGGAAEGPSDGMAVDRLGPPGSALMSKGAHALLVAGSRAGLREARARSDRPREDNLADGVRFAVDPGALDGSISLPSRRLGAALAGASGPVTGEVHLAGSKLSTTIEFPVRKPDRPATVDPRWLDWMPGDRVMAALVFAVDAEPARLDSMFRLADRIEKADPARGQVAPIRLRLDLMARAIGLRLDGELLPHLRGVTAWLGGEGRSADRAFVMLHLDDEAIAVRVFEQVRPPTDPGPGPGPGQGRRLGVVEGRVVRLFRSGPSVVATWGDGAMEAALAARDRPEPAAGMTFGGRWPDPAPTVLAAAWPSVLVGLLPADTPFTAALLAARPMTWAGGWTGRGRFQLDGSWGGLDEVVRRFLDAIPLDPPPDR